MLSIRAAIVITIAYVACSEFMCPQLEKEANCTCSNVIWWDNQDLSIVDCSSSQLQEVPNLLLDQNYKITKLLLGNNNITELSVGDFDNLSIYELHLNNNGLKTLRKEALLPLSSMLAILDLKGNEITLDEDLSFVKGFTNLQELFLDSNVIQSDENDMQIFPNDIFKDLGLKSLLKLSMRSCGMNKIRPGAFAYLPSLQDLDLTYNYLEEVPSAILTLTNLKRLVLSGNNIMSIERNSFKNLQYLEEIVLNYNDISTIEAGAFNGLQKSLKTLELHSNYLSEIPNHALSNLDRLSFIKVSKNNLTFIKAGSFGGMSGLKTLEMDSNEIMFHSEMFSGLEDTLETLVIRDTGLTSLPVDAVKRLKKLTYLDISRNLIGTRFESPIGFSNIRTLVLSNNNLKTISSKAFEGLRNPIGLDLDNNNITNVSFILDSRPCSFRYVDLTGNPLLCNCQLEYIFNSGIMYGVGLTGQCQMPDGQYFELGSSKLIRALDRKCNYTERKYRCYSLKPLNAACAQNSSFSVFLSAFILVLIIQFKLV